MKYSITALVLISFIITSFKSIDNNENTNAKIQESKNVILSIEIDATQAKVWDIITNKDNAKILGNEFVKNGFIESDWKLNSKVNFKYQPDQVIYTGTITKLIENEFIQIDYNFGGPEYVEKFSIEKNDSKSTLSINASPYGSDPNAQKKVWQNWLAKVKELSEK